MWRNPSLLSFATSSYNATSLCLYRWSRMIFLLPQYCSRISAQGEQNFSAVQTTWRRERDSNPRYGFPYSGFQDHPFQPLTHPSKPLQTNELVRNQHFRTIARNCTIG